MYNYKSKKGTTMIGVAEEGVCGPRPHGKWKKIQNCFSCI